ncbi:MAG: GntR family transcriptional regulator [Parasphingorhabdus sp.]|uniref:GntR family transcriptional regulator n=1 Tax=Parasphingorhabdus sp. TaxID=2709688 RepID=UPI0030028778
MNNASKPVYLKLRDIISESILDGEYGEGDMLPSVRAFAVEQGANPLTVAKAYQGFQEDGLVTVKRGVGMFVASGAKAKLRDAQRADFIKNIWPPVERQMKRLDIKLNELLENEA